MERFQKISKLREAAASGKSAVALQGYPLIVSSLKIQIDNPIHFRSGNQFSCRQGDN